MDRELLVKETSDILAAFSLKVEMLSKAGLFSVNKMGEDMFARIFSTLLGLNLKNINSEEQNFPAVDLIDHENRVAFQITSDVSNTKVYTTLEKFMDYNLYRRVDTIYIYSIGKRESKISQKKILEIVSRDGVSFNFVPQQHIIDNVFILEKVQEVEPKRAEEFLVVLREEFSALMRLLKDSPITGTEVFVTFSSENYELGLKVIEGLATRNFTIYHNSVRLQDEPSLESKKGYIVYTNGPGTHKISKCLAILSGQFISERWTKGRFDAILLAAIEHNAEIFVYKTSNNNLPASLQSKNILYDPIRVNKNDFQVIIDDFSEKVQLNDPGSQSLILYRRFESIIKKVYPNYLIERIVADERRGYEVYRCLDKILYVESYFFCFHRGAELKPSYDHIKNSLPKVARSSQKIVLLPRERNLEVSRRRKETLDELINPIKTFFVEDFLMNCISDQFRIAYTPFDIKDFVEPIIVDTSESPLSYQSLVDWFDAPNHPIMVIKGLGGVGKSTLVQKLADDFILLKPDATVIYIDSIEILTELERLNIRGRDFDLYYFYNAYIDKVQHVYQHIMQLDDDTFKAALDSGNILFVIDGLDEVIAHFPQFNVDNFIVSTLNYSEDLAKGNIIITCRSYFWTDSLLDDELGRNGSLQISIVSLQPFDDTSAERFFAAKIPESVPNRHARIKRSMELAQAFINPKVKNGGNGQGNKFIPFVLSIINNMMDYEDQLDSVTSQELDSIYLSPNSKTDYITNAICAREQTKIGQITVNDQIRFFITLAISNLAGSNLKLSFSEFDALLKEFDHYYHENARDTFKSHPLFKFNRSADEISFRYDFLTEYFKSIYVASFLTGISSQENPDFHFGSQTIRIIANYVRINSGFAKEIYHHIGSYSDGVYSNIKDLIESCYLYNLNDVTDDQRKRAMSGLTGIAILLTTSFNPHIDNNTKVIKDLFLGNYGLKDLHIIDYTASDEHLRTIFDFSDVTLVNCTFENYDHFWDCKFNQNTKFVGCVLKNLKEGRFHGTTLTRENFRECDMDEWIRKMLDDKLFDVPRKRMAQVTSELKTFLSIFIFSGRLRPVSIKANLTLTNRKRLLETKVVINELRSSGVIESLDNEFSHGDRVQISKQYEQEVLSFCQSGIKAPRIASLINRLSAIN